jgi:hypothetical protein
MDARCVRVNSSTGWECAGGIKDNAAPASTIIFRNSLYRIPPLPVNTGTSTTVFNRNIIQEIGFYFITINLIHSITVKSIPEVQVLEF